VETRKWLLAQIKARQKQGVDELFQDMDAARRLVFDTQVVELENQIECLIAGDVARAETVQILGSVPGIGPVASTMLIAEISGRNIRAWSDSRRTGSGSDRSRADCP